MDNLCIYLAGGMGDLTWEQQTRWRNNIINAIRCQNYDSVANLKKTCSFVSPPDYYNFEEKKHKSELEVMEFDLYKLKNCDIVVVNFNDEKSIGTSMELAVARENGIPIIGLNIEKKQLHPWLECSCMRICDNMQELVNYLAEFFLN